MDILWSIHSFILQAKKCAAMFTDDSFLIRNIFIKVINMNGEKKSLKNIITVHFEQENLQNIIT